MSGNQKPLGMMRYVTRYKGCNVFQFRYSHRKSMGFIPFSEYARDSVTIKEHVNYGRTSRASLQTK